MGEGTNNLGGSSKQHLLLSVGLEKVTRALQSLGFPGSCSQRNGTEAEVCSGGVSIPGLSGDCICISIAGIEKSGSLGMLFCSASQPMAHSMIRDRIKVL